MVKCKKCNAELERIGSIQAIGISHNGDPAYRALYGCPNDSWWPFSGHTQKYIVKIIPRKDLDEDS